MNILGMEESGGGVDWHVHSWEGSRESVPLEELIKCAKEAKLDAIAITDHNSVEAIDRAIEIAGEDIEIVPGIELDAMYNGRKVHIICYFPDYKNPEFKKDFHDLNKPRRVRMFKVLKKFFKEEYIERKDYRHIFSKLKDSNVYTVQSISDILINFYKDKDTKLGRKIRELDSNKDYHKPDGTPKGDIPLLNKFMYEFLDKKRTCYVKYDTSRVPGVKEIVDFCTKYGAPCGFAHVWADLAKEEQSQKYVAEAVISGIKSGMMLLGVEHPKHDKQVVEFLRELSSDAAFYLGGVSYQIIQLNGTDYHAKLGEPRLGEIKSPRETLEQVKDYSHLLAA